MRSWVLDALMEVICQGQYSNLYLKHHLKECAPKDRALATHIFYGTLQNYGYLNYCVNQYVKKKIPNRVRILLLMSVYQLFFLDKVPVYAVVNEAVELTKIKNPSFSGLVNAFLHRVKRKDIVLPEKEEETLSILYSVPSWLVYMWKAQYGMEQTREMLLWTNQTLPIYVRRNALGSTIEDFEKPEFTAVQNDLYIYHGNDVAAHPYYQQGKMSIQDIGSYEIACFVDAKPGMHILDTCAAPGTKTMAMAEMMEDSGQIVSVDLHAHRVKLIENDAKRLHLQSVKAICRDARDLEDLGLFDRVLCDVPCSGYGILARKPDIRLRMKSEDMDALIPLQQGILESGSLHVKENGILVYSTCTINKKENEKQIQSFLKKHRDFALLEEKTIFPSRGQDGFYMAKLEKRQDSLL